MHQVLAALGIICVLILSLVIYWATRPLPIRED